MFESLVANILNRFLGAYVENFDPKQLNIGIWSGDVKLRNLKLKKESLDKFKLPIDVKYGYVGELTVQIPWSNLKSKAAKVFIDDVYLVVSPVVLQDFDLEEDERREQLLKQEKLKDLETLEQTTAQNETLSKDMSKNMSFTESLATKVIDNLQVTINNIHVRYEDDSILTESPYSLGITLDELSAVSTDELWAPSFISITQAFTRKLLTLKNLSCYMETDSTNIYKDDHEKLMSALKEYITIDGSEKELQYLLRPVSGTGRLTLQKAGATEKAPHIKAELFFEEFGIELDSKQYQDILWTASKFHWFMKTEKFRKFRPKVSVSESPKEWFRYAARSVLDEIHEKNYKWSWEYFAQRRAQRKAYVRLWKTKLIKQALTVEQKKELAKLEHDLSFEDIKFYRSLSKREIRKEKKMLPSFTSSKPSDTTSEKSGSSGDSGSQAGWFSWWRGSSTDNEKSDGNSLDLSLSEAQRKALYDAIDYDDTRDLAESIDIPRDRVKFEVLASLRKGGLSVRRKRNEDCIAEVIFEGMNAQYYQRPDSFFSSFQLQEFRVEDGTKNTIYKHIVSVKHSHANLHELEKKSSPFFHISYEHKPLDLSADSRLSGKLKSMTIFYNPGFAEELMKFFKPPKIHLDTVGAIMNAAEATVEGITEQTRIGLQYALEEHKTIDVQLDLQAPLIILPLDPSTVKSPVAIVDAGHISVSSNLVDNSKIEEIRSKDNYQAQDWNELNTLMYDQFSLHLQEAQFLVGPNVKTTMEQLHGNGDESALILDKLDMKLILSISILSDAYHLPKLKLGGEVPNIALGLNDFQYKTIMQLIDVAIPSLDSSDMEDSDLFDAFGKEEKRELYTFEDSDSDSKPNKQSTKNSSQTEAMLTQHQFDFDFNVSSVRLSLSRCIDPLTLKAEPLVDLVGDSLNIKFFKTTNDMHLDLTLGDVNLIDFIEKSGVPEFEKLVSSNFDEKKDDHKDLFKLKYSRIQRDVDFKGRSIVVFDQDINVDLATLKFVISRKSILSILNFVLNTFTDPNADPSPADELKHNDANDEISPQKINVVVRLDSIILVLNEDGIKLATLELSTANIKTFLVPEAMEVSGKLGALTLQDETSEGSSEDSILRNLITMEGDNLAEFSYQTFDLQTNQNLYSSATEFKTSSIKINFVESSFNKILNFLNKFQRMKAIYDRARDVAINQANQIEDAGGIKFNISLNAPTIVFPHLNPQSKTYDTITFSLGKIYASNDFSLTNGVRDNAITAGITNVTLESNLYFPDAYQKASILKNIDLSFDISYLEKYVADRPTIKILGKSPETVLELTELQAGHLKNFADSVTRLFSLESEEALTDIEADAINANAVVKHDTEIRQTKANTQLQVEKNTNNELRIPKDHLNVDLSFELPSLSLTLYQNTYGLTSFKDNTLSEFSLNGLKCTFKMKEDGHYSADFKVNSFTVSDIRKTTENKFREIIPPLGKDQHQIELGVISDGSSSDKNLTVTLEVRNPRTILAVDWLIDLNAFFSQSFDSFGTSNKETFKTSEEAGDIAFESNTRGPEENYEPVLTPKLGFSVNIIAPSVTLLADPSNEATEAIVFKVEQILLTKQNIMSLAASNIGLFLSTMDDFENTDYRIIDDFSISLAHDARESDIKKFLTKIESSIDPLLVRVSLRDIRLALQIFHNAMDFYDSSLNNQGEIKQDNEFSYTEDFKKRLAQYAPSVRTHTVEETAREPEVESTFSEVIIKGEEFNASFGGLRFVLIGDVHELPVLDLRVNAFDIRAVNWSTDLSAEAHIESLVNIYNYSRSTWEPFVEPWPVSFYASRSLEPMSSIVVDVVSRKLAEVSISSRSLALLSQVFTLITAEEGLKKRGEDSPYRIVNETGYDIKVWAAVVGSSSEKVIKQKDVASWAFESWSEIREHLDTNSNIGVLGVRLLDSPYEDVPHVSATGEGEDIFMLNPPINGVHNRLSCEITLGSDNVKTIWLRSTIKIQNRAERSILVKLADDKTNKSYEVVIDPEDTKSLPIDLIYSGSVKIKPYIESAYDWSTQTLNWKEFQPSIPISCQSRDTEEKGSYFYQVETIRNPDEPLAKIFPHLTLIVSAPVQIENLLPFDFTYRLYDKSSKKDWSGSIEKGVNSYIHVVSLKSLLLLSVSPSEGNFPKSDFAIINAPENSGFKREKILSLRHKSGQLLKLRIHYPKNEEKTGLRITVYSPYVILNRTGEDLVVSEKGNSLVSHGNISFGPVHPNLFSFDVHGDRRNRALVKVGNSTWSSPLSFDAIGQSSEAKVQLSGKQLEINMGVTVSEGEGKYNLTKVVTIAPRYVIKSTMDELLQIVENGSTRVVDLTPNKFVPLYGLFKADKRSILIKFKNSSSDWSSPFNLNDVGQVFIKLSKEGLGQVLLKVNILLENSTIFIQIENANNSWPFSIRNFSDSEFYLYQGDPNVNSNGEVVKNDINYKPIYYKLPPKSVIPYAYDFPNGIVKELIIRSHGRERPVNLAEIGNLKPFRLPPTDDSEQAIVDLNVVADGPTQSLIITNYDPSVSLYKIKSKAGSTVSTNQQFEATESDENYHTRLITKFEGFGISLINLNSQELCYITLRGLEIRYNESDLYQNLSVKLKWIQIDNQLYGGIFPIVVYPSVVPKSGKEMNSHPSFSGSISRVKDNSHGVLFIKYATVLLQEMTIEIDEDFLFALIDFSKVPGASWNKEHRDKLCDDVLELPEPSALSDKSDIYFEGLHLQPALTNLSFVRTERVNAEDKSNTSQNTLMFFFNVLTMAIGNINDAPIKLNALFIENIRVPMPILVESVKTHYGQAFFYQVHKVLGSADFLGNPVGLFNHLSSGVLDIFYEPYNGFILNDRPQELGIGIAKGGLSFMKKSIFGFSDSFAKFTGSVAKGLSVATLDTKFQERRRLNQHRNKPKHALYGFASGANSFFDSISSGVTGIATAPIEGANRGGASGFFRGIGKGVVGLPTKTAIGFFDLASNVSEGIRNTTTVFDEEGLDKVRLPRYISYDKVVRPYSQRESQGQFWLKSIDGGVFFNEVYLAHLVLTGEEQAIAVTFKKIILFNINTLVSSWSISFNEIRGISIEPTGILIGLKARSERFIPVPDRKSRTFLYGRIKVAVEDYNKRCSVVL